MAVWEESGQRMSGDESASSSARRSRSNDSNVGRADLHLHTTFSDGALSPQELVQKAHQAGLSVIAVTDHDNVAAIDEAMEWGKSVGVEVVPGLELSATMGEKDLHILAYFFDHKNQTLLDYLTFFRHERYKRAERIVEKLNKINVPLELEAVLEQAGVGSIGRPHIANAMVEQGFIDSYHEAFSKYIGVGGPAYEKKYQVSPQEAFQLISKAGGLSFLAHPGKYTTELELSELIDLGMDGIEVVHPSHDSNRQAFYRSVVDQYFLLESGGSDFHGGKKSDEYALGSFWVPLPVVDAMRKRLFR
ncbi:MAG TPA: PHP domain-containing protein [Bacteroidota bacterium]|nr:PHP domain-containing protein [Bacteroidota bacterium]